MADSLKITGLYLDKFHQFQDFSLDFTHPETGEPLEKICLIGSNGTGKSTLLRVLSSWLNSNYLLDSNFIISNRNFPTSAYFGIEIQASRKQYFATHENLGNMVPAGRRIQDISNSRFIYEKASSDQPKSKIRNQPWNLKEQSILNQISLKNNNHDLAVFVSPEGDTKLFNRQNKEVSLPDTNLSSALKFTRAFPFFHIVSSEQVSNFWDSAIFQIKNRDSRYQEYLNLPEVQKVSVATAKQEFDHNNPEFLQELANVWDKILNQAGLRFDYQSAKVPIQLNENLTVHIVSQKNGVQVPYNSLSTGIRNYIFRIGHIFSLYFQRDIQRGFLFLDEPEQSLFPDFLFDIIERYKSITQNTQMFVATQSPIVASQFEPHERFILDFDENGYVTVRRGVSPIGDDPNDLLLNDFTVRSLYGKKGLEKWERFLELRTLIDETEDKKEKATLIKEYAQIGTAYNFAPNEISR